ncbi:MAG: LptF/LptG family permease [Planctomycetes bacterium]|nr:LptF/LptG family permease [Planctomycetota bacterium]
MSILDRYVGRIVLGSFAAGMVFFLCLMIIMDLLGNLPRYISRADDQGWSTFDLAVELVGYYLTLLPVLFVTVTPFVTVIACMFAVARIQNGNEIVPMLFVGRPMQRVLRPMLLLGFAAAFGMAGCWQWIVPHLSAALAESEGVLNRGSEKQKHLVHEWVKGDSTYRLYIAEFVPSRSEMSGVNMLIEGVLVADNMLVTAAAARWDEARKDWQLQGGRCETERGWTPRGWLERPDLTPAALLQSSRENIQADTQSYTELAATMTLRPNRADVRLAFHRHITYPFANLILLLIALPLAVWFERGSRIERVLTAIALCGLYAMFDLVCQSLGQKGHLHPVVAAWSPTIVFGSLGAVLYGGMKT